MPMTVVGPVAPKRHTRIGLNDIIGRHQVPMGTAVRERPWVNEAVYDTGDRRWIFDVSGEKPVLRYFIRHDGLFHIAEWYQA